jgi:hypothetical protein
MTAATDKRVITVLRVRGLENECLVEEFRHHFRFLGPSRARFIIIASVHS